LVVEQGMGLILITHDLAVVADLADHLAIMNAGRVVEAGATRDVLTQMRHPYTRALFAASSHQPVRRPRIARKTLLQVEGVVREYPLPRKGLFARHDTFCAVKGVSFELRRGESLGLVGESGCGKSTLTRAILGLDLIQAGRVVLDGEEVHAARSMPDTLARHGPGGVPGPLWQFQSAPPGVTLGERALPSAPRRAEGCRATAVRRGCARGGRIAAGRCRQVHPRILRRSTPAHRHRPRPDHPPGLIVLDEAVSALDVSIRAQILDLLADLSDEFGLSYLL
jgi:peptide/nickel transport system ATP-binding protein